MSNKPKNRRINLTRGRRRAREVTPVQRETTYDEIPTGARREIRRLIEEEGYGSTTEIAKSLNKDGYPCAQAEAWDAKLVDSAFRRQDMSDLKGKLHENRGPEEAPSLSTLAFRQAAYDGVKQALSDLNLKAPEIPPLKVDTFIIKGAVADAVTEAVKLQFRQLEDNIGTPKDMGASVMSAVDAVLNKTDLPSIRRVTEATGRNVGDILKKIDDTCGELDGTVRETVEELMHEIYGRVDSRFDKLEDALAERLVGDDSSLLEDVLTKVVDQRLKSHLDTAVNQFAVMVDGLRRELREENGKRKGRR